MAGGHESIRTDFNDAANHVAMERHFDQYLPRELQDLLRSPEARFSEIRDRFNHLPQNIRDQVGEDLKPFDLFPADKPPWEYELSVNGLIQVYQPEVFLPQLFQLIDGSDSPSVSERISIFLQQHLNAQGFHTGYANTEMQDLAQAFIAKNPNLLSDFLFNRIGTVIPFKAVNGQITPDVDFITDDLISARLGKFYEKTGITPLTMEQQAVLAQEVRARFQDIKVDIPFAQSDPALRAQAPAQFLMVTPYENHLGSAFFERLEIRRKWESVHETIKRNGGDVEVIEGFSEGAAAGSQSREVFSRDRFFIIGDTAYLPDPGVLENVQDPAQIEGYGSMTVQARERLGQLGYKTERVEGAWFEGGNILLHQDSKTILFGADQYFKQEYGDLLLQKINATQQEAWSMQVVPLLDTKIFYHLDTGVSAQLPDGHVVMYPGVTDAETYEKIQNIYGVENIIEVDFETAKEMVTNFNFVGRTIIMTDSTTALEGQLEDLGYNVITPEELGIEDDLLLGENAFGRGGVHCITNELPSLPSSKPLDKASLL